MWGAGVHVKINFIFRCYLGKWIIDLIDDEIEQYLSYTQQLVLNVDGQSTNKSKTLRRRANDLLSTLAQNIEELKNEMKDGKKEKRKQTTVVVQSFFWPSISQT